MKTFNYTKNKTSAVIIDILFLFPLGQHRAACCVYELLGRLALGCWQATVIHNLTVHSDL